MIRLEDVTLIWLTWLLCGVRHHLHKYSIVHIAPGAEKLSANLPSSSSLSVFLNNVHWMDSKKLVVLKILHMTWGQNKMMKSRKGLCFMEKRFYASCFSPIQGKV